MEISHITDFVPERTDNSVCLTLDYRVRKWPNGRFDTVEVLVEDDGVQETISYESITASVTDGELLVSDYDYFFTYMDNIIENKVFHIDSSLVKKCLGLEGSASDEDLLISIRDRFHGNYSGIVAWLVDNNIAFETSYYNAMEEWEEQQSQVK